MFILNGWLKTISWSYVWWKPHLYQLHSRFKNTYNVNLSKTGSRAQQLNLCSTCRSPYQTDCAEIWGNNSCKSLPSLYILKKRAVRINKAGNIEHLLYRVVNDEALSSQTWEWSCWCCCDDVSTRRVGAVPGNIKSNFWALLRRFECIELVN